MLALLCLLCCCQMLCACCVKVRSAEGVRDDNVCEYLLAWDDNLQVWSTTVLRAQPDRFLDSCCSRLRGVSVQSMHDGVVTHVNLAALVRVAREVMPAVISNGSGCFA